MFAIDDPTAVAVMPAPEGAGTPGFWTEGNPALGQAATYVRASFLNMLQSELLNILTAAGVTPSKTTYDQLLTSFRSNALVTANDTGPANACAIAYTPAITTLTDGMVLWFKAAAANTGATTLAVNAVGVKNVVGGAHAPLQGGEIVVGGKCMVVWNAAIPAFVLIECTGAALQVAPATKASHAPQMSQVAGVVGSVRNLRAGLAAASATCAFTADEVIVETALGGTRYCLPSFNKTINLATTGAGAMDAGTAPVSGWVAIYAIYNPATGVSNVLAANATAAAAPEVYGGANMPSGYTASALISVLPTTAGSLLGVFQQFDRRVDYYALVLNSSTPTGFASTSLASCVPRNAKSWRGNGAMASSTTSFMAFSACPTVTGIGTPGYVAAQTVSVGAGGTVGGTIPDTPIVTPQTTFYAWSNGAGTGTLTLNSYGYGF
ncbi:hypothetical protein [Variovorax sp. PAMC26660]|uniref:hypothetical protein n=1 Tax=Variovorax sp. PAMC26660 TaxID=2762322 RepID=UPI00164DB781|nr:hypothetical protein [Variovorax sp. PAMC26660]QNK65770.1 hypothetical protein H7F35_21445 [Variovorax sp. PAMC26660]